VFEIVPRTSSVDSIVREQQFQRSGLTDSDTIADLGKMMNAAYVVSGHGISFSGKKLLLISIVDVKTMQQTAGDYQEYAEIEDIRALLPKMAANIIASVQAQNESHGPALAVLPLNIVDEEAVQQGDAEILAQILATEIANGHTYAVFPRTSTIETVMKELDIQKSALTDPDTMIEIRKATNAEFVLAGTVTKLGEDMNLFDVKILDVVSGVLKEGVDRPYAELSDGIGLMQQLAYDLTGVESSRLAEKRQQEQQAADEALRQQAEDRKRQKAENFKKGLDKFFRGSSGNRFASIGVNGGFGLESKGGLGDNGFVSVSVTVPLIGTLFAEGGVDLGFSGSTGQDYANDKAIYSAVRTYGRLNIGIPAMKDPVFYFIYFGIGLGHTSAAFGFEETRTFGYTNSDLVIGWFITGEHHGIRLELIHFMGLFELYDVDSHASGQWMLGYVYRF
jgi:TolB-like protein